MDISIATARPATQQANSVRSLVPMHLREGAENFIGFLEDYYSYINTDGLPSQEIVNIVSEHDIDRTSSQYIDLIQGEIAKNVPNAVAFDKVSLYKKIVEYYLTKGSEDSIINFFKIFYDESITLKYPRERLFKTSSGTWDQENKRYRDTKGFSSNSDVLQDSHFWQDFSYVIESAVPVSEWKNEFLGLVHPAGFKFFGVLVLLLVRRKKWIGRFIKYNSETRAYEYDNLPENYYTPYKTYYTEDLDWMKSLTPPSRSNQSGYGDQDGDHMPMFQYGLLGNHIIQNLCLIANTTDEDFIRLVIRTLHLWAVADCDHYELTRSDYLTNLKFLDSGVIGEYSDTLIKYGNTYPCQDVSKPVIDFLEANVPLGQTPIDYECLIDESGDDLIDENGDCINATFTAGFDAHRELDPQESEALGQTTNEIRVIDKVNYGSIFVTRDGGTLYDNYLNRTTFSNISTFITTERDTCLVGTMTDGGEPSYDSIVTDDGDNLCLYFDYDEHERGLLELHPNAAAAYSLRLLDDVWKDMPVVEVRRASDDTTAGFTATEVSDDTLTNWVNTEMALPLDTASGAAAAYSLRDLSVSRADLTSSGDTGGETTGALVAQVRRSSDDEIKSFTAAEVAGSAMVDWVNTVQAVMEFDGVDDSVTVGAISSGSSDWRFYFKVLPKAEGFRKGIFSGNSQNQIYINSGDVGVFCQSSNYQSSLNVPLNEVSEVEVYHDTTASEMVFVVNGVEERIADSTDTGFSSAANIGGPGASFINAIIFELAYDAGNTGSFDNQWINTGNTLSDWQDKIGSKDATAINGTPTTTDFSAWDGYVTKWYDQSGNDNHAEQTTEASQPKIVDAGVLVTEGGAPAIKPDGVDDHLDLTSNITGGDYSVFATYQSSSNPSYLFSASGGYLNVGRRAGTGVWVYNHSGGGLLTSTSHPSTRVLGHFQGIGEDVSIYGNGALIDSASGVGVNPTSIAGIIGNYGPTYYWDGTIQEIIIYDSDQSDNRKAIESNIGDHYGISGFDQADGYVTTWYDQSGNGNNATQPVSTSQPKIVGGGSLVANGIRFDGHHLACGSLLSGDQSRSTFTVAAPENDQFFHSFGTLNYNGSMWSLSAEVAMRCKAYVWVSSTPATYFQNNLITNTYSGGSLFSTNAIYLNGNTVTKTSGTDGTVNTDPIGDFKIASLPSGSSTYVGAISEIIIYDSDQSDDREKIESNINNHYNVF